MSIQADLIKGKERKSLIYLFQMYVSRTGIANKEIGHLKLCKRIWKLSDILVKVTLGEGEGEKFLNCLKAS